MTYDEYQAAVSAAAQVLANEKREALGRYNATHKRLTLEYQDSPANRKNRELVSAWVSRKGVGSGTRYLLHPGHPIAGIASCAGNAGAWATTSQLKDIFGPYLAPLMKGNRMVDADVTRYVTRTVTL